MPIKKSDLYSSLWASCDELRGRSDIGARINTQIIAPLVDANKGLARSDFPNFNDPANLGEGAELVERLTKGTGQLNRREALHDAGGKVRPSWPADSVVTAVFSECQWYRYQLREIWDPAKPLVLWILMNPSVACTDYSDPTLRKTGKFSRAWGYGGQLVGNVHAYRATDKNRLLEVADPAGPENDRHILEMAGLAKTIVLAYGQPPKALRKRSQELTALLSHHADLCYLRLSQDGTPVHPLYLPETLRPIPL